MKKLLGLLLILGLMASAVYSANPDSCTLTVTPGVTYSIKITTGTANATTDFGTVNLGSTYDIFVATVSNNGNVAMGIKKKGAVPSGWTLADASGDGAVKLEIGFCTNTSTVGAYTSNVSTVGSASQSATSVNFVAAAASSGMSARITMPTTSSLSGTQTITLSLYADTTW